MKTHARNTVNTNEFKDDIFHGNKPQTANTLLFTAILRNDFSKNTFFFAYFWLLKPPKTKRGGYPPTPPPNFKDFTQSKTSIFGFEDASGASFFDGIYDVLCTRLNFYTKKCNIKNYQKITKKPISPWCSAFLGSRPLPKTDPSQGQFLTVFAMFYAHRALLKKEPLFCLGGGRRHMTHPLYLKLRQRRMPCGPICPASDALCIAGFKTG